MQLVRNKTTGTVHMLTPYGHIYCNNNVDIRPLVVFTYDGTEITCAKCKKGLDSYIAILKYNINIPGHGTPPATLLGYLAPYLLHTKRITVK